MAGDTKAAGDNNGGKPKKRRYLPHGKPVRKGLYPLRPGVQGFFITCDGGRERQASNEALSLLENFYEELVDGKESGPTRKAIPVKPVNKVTKFEDPDSSSDEDEPSPIEEEPGADKHQNENKDEPANTHSEETEQKSEDKLPNKQREETEEESEGKPAKKQCIEAHAKCDTIDSVTAKDKSIDDLIEEELKEMGDRSKRHFVSLDSGCNGCIFIQMNKGVTDPGPSRIVQHMMSSAASTRKHMSRFILRVVPAEVTCYASEEEISKAIKPLIEQYFPTEALTPQKFAVLYEARANTGIERMKIINAVAKSVPQLHKVDLSNPDKTIIVQVAKTICMIGVAEKYKELSKYNLRQLTAPQQKLD